MFLEMNTSPSVKGEECSMLEWIFIAILSFVILTFFHNQASFEYKISQIGWEQREGLSDLLMERVPLVVKGMPPVSFWTHQDILMRDCYNPVPLFDDSTLSEWLVTTTSATACPWSSEHARLLGEVSGLGIWMERELHPAVHTNSLWASWYRGEPSCWAGERSLWRSSARWTIIMPTEGAIQVSIMAGSKASKKSLPPSLESVHPSRLTVYDTPFVSDLKYIDIVLRTGAALIMPSHWYISWTSLFSGESGNSNSVCPMVCIIEYHTPISLFGRWVASS